jgi:antitoxin component of RelBE/YafQ-DinJ toxin-antitoxin module
MATLSLRMRDDLKRKAQEMAAQQGVSLNSFINATLAATIAQAETLEVFASCLQGLDQAALRKRVMKFMGQTHPGDGPSMEAVRKAIRGE